MIYDAGDLEQCGTPAPLAARAYFARLTQGAGDGHRRPDREGRALRGDIAAAPPQGRGGGDVAGRVAPTQITVANWERVALLRPGPHHRGRCRAAQEVEGKRRAMCCTPKSTRATVRADVAEMRARLAAAGQVSEGAPGDAERRRRRGDGTDRADGGPAGRVSTGSADQITAGVAAGGLTVADGAALVAANALLWQVRARRRVCCSATSIPTRWAKAAGGSCCTRRVRWTVIACWRRWGGAGSGAGGGADTAAGESDG